MTGCDLKFMPFTPNKIIYEDLSRIIAEPTAWNRFSNKTILITGANGFLPAYMVETLLFLTHKKKVSNLKVIALVRNIVKARVRFSDHLNNKNLKILVQDVCDPLIIKGKIDYIVHAASQASPKYYGVDPVGTLLPNTVGTINLLRFAQTKSVESFLFFSSSEVYGNLGNNIEYLKENNFGYLNPTDLRSCYSESKRLGETACVSWFHQHAVPAKIVRPFHTYGPGMSLDDGRVYADFVAAVLAGKDIVLNSDGSAVRSFCYLADATIAFFNVLLNGEAGEAYNVGNPKSEISIFDLAKIVASIFPEKKISVRRKEKLKEGYIKSGVKKNCPDLAKISVLGWKPTTQIKEGFYRTIKSYE